MRILEARFKNLNSLAGEWIVNFQAPEFDLNGLFLITGPTGAGKTTLLDAISLALYGRTHRVEVSSSQNEIMTRQTNECWAEVVFENEKGRFRSRWQQTRKKDGKLNQPVRIFSRADDETILASKITDVEKAVARYTGLDFKQFCRSIMLAQNAFSAFLDAKDDEKSAILEKLTDTSIYSELSVLAHLKESEAARKKDELKKEIENIGVLAPEDVAEKSRDLEKYSSELQAISDALAICRKNIDWLGAIARLEREAAELASAGQRYQEELAAFEPGRTELAAARDAAELEPVYARLTELRAQAGKAEQKRCQLEAETAALAELATGQDGAVEQARSAVAASGAELDQAQPLLKAARELDHALIEKKVDLETSQEQIQAQQARLEQKRSELEARSLERSNLEGVDSDISGWLAQNSRDSWLVENWGELREKMKSLHEQWRLVGEAEKAVPDLAMESEKIVDQIEKEKLDLEKAASFEKESAAIIADLEDKKSGLLGGWTLEGLRSAHKDKLGLKATAAAVKSLEEHRKGLVDGQPCPLCGAFEHPYAQGQIPDPDVVDIQCRELEKQISDIEAIVASIADREKDKEAAAREVVKIGERLKGLEDQRKLLTARSEDAALHAANLKKAALEKEEIIRLSLQPLGLGQVQDMAQTGQELEQRRKAWLDHIEQQRATEGSLAALAPVLASLETEVRSLSADLDGKKTELVNQNEILEKLVNERAVLLGGNATEAEERRLVGALDQARQALEEAQRRKAEVDNRLSGATRARIEQEDQLRDLAPALGQTENEFVALLARKSWKEQDFAAAQRPPEAIRELERRSQELAEKGTQLATRITENSKNLNEARSLELTDKTMAALEAEEENLRARSEAAHEARAKLKHELDLNAAKEAQAQEAQRKLDVQMQDWERWSQLDGLIGSANGKKFRAFAQNITLDLLLAHANAQLAKITDRYILQRRPGKEVLEIAIVDNYQAGDVRAVKNLSGGESFIVSLALALGLSEMAGGHTTLGSLFLDEGFGTLDSKTLETAIEAIASLRSEGKLIGIISHVEELKRRIPTQIAVTPKQMGRSEISGPGCARP